MTGEEKKRLFFGVSTRKERRKEGKEEKKDGYYQQGERTRDGTGKYYMGREISQVMGHLGAGWLERP